MADLTVMATIYANEFTTVYEQKQSFVRGTVTTEGVVNGNEYVFIIEGAAAPAVTRGASGNIPCAADNQSSTTCTLAEYHHLARKNNFNIASSSAPQRESMQRRGTTSINQRTDQLIFSQMATTSYNTGAAAALTLGMMLKAGAILDTNYVPDDGERYGLLSPNAWAQAMKINQWTSWDWVGENNRPFMRQTQWREWNNIKWARHPNLPGTGTASASCFVYHKSAVGHGLNGGEQMTRIGVQEEQDYSWARTTAYMGGKMLQGGGVVILAHDDTAAI